MSVNRKKPNTALSKTAKSLWHAVVFGLTFSIASVVSFAQTASYHDHNIFHGAGTAFVNTSPQAQAVGDGGVLRAQLIWQVTPGQTKGADLDIHAKLPSGQGAYTVTQFDPVGALPGTPQKTPPFGNPNTASDGNQQVNWVNRQVVFSNGQAVASLDQDNRTGVANAPTGKLVENIYLQGTTNPNYIPSGVYQFAVHNYNQTKLADPTASYAVWITTNGRVGARSTTHSTLYENTANPTQPAFYGTLTAEGQSSEIYGIEIITPAGETPHAPGITVVDAKRRYLDAWHAEQARLAEIRRQQALYHQAMANKAKSEDQFCTNGYQSVACNAPGAFKFTEQVLVDLNSATENKSTPYQQKITITNYKDERNLFGTLRVVDSEYSVIATSKEQAKQLLAIESAKHRNASDVNNGVVNNGNTTFKVIDYASYMPVLGEGLSLGSAISGISTSGEEISGWERGASFVGAIPGIGKAKKAGNVVDFIGDASQSAKFWNPKKHENLSSVQNALGHWYKHQEEFPELQNSKQYVEAAKDFIKNPPVTAIKKQKGDEIGIYDHVTNTVAFTKPDGTPKTFFRPNPNHPQYDRTMKIFGDD